MSAGGKLSFLHALQEECGGAIPFERWMSEALYHREFGYYTAHIRDLGRRGDFTTWPQMHDSLARGIARWALTHRPGRRWHLIEVGAGTGELAAGILRAIGWWNRPHYHIVDVSGPLRERQKKLLGGKAQWHETMAEALTACDGEALIVSNELADAFPCRIFRQESAGWSELSLEIAGSRLREHWNEVVPPDSTVFAHEWPDGQVVEVQESFHRWFEGWRAGWQKGRMLTIDYGDACPEIYRRRPRGTLRAYAHHQRLEGAEAYAGFGVRDLTVDVNFSDLEKWLPGSSGMVALGEFLRGQQIADVDRLGEAGEAFKVLESRSSS